MNINSKLNAFAQQELVMARSDAERERINASLIHLEQILRNKLGGQVQQFIRFGSFTRNTILPRDYDPNSDVDLLVVFNIPSGTLSPGTYRKKIQDVIAAAYPSSISKKDFPVIKLELKHIMFDIVPAIYANDFWNKKLYNIPGPGDTWLTTEPNDLNKALSTANQRDGGNQLRNVIRLCKHWNAHAGYPQSSYLMEKEIINLMFIWELDIFPRFLKTMNRIAGNRPGVRQALEHIEKYKGGWGEPANLEKQMQWLRKLLPKLP